MANELHPRRIVGVSPEMNRIQEVFARPLERLSRLPLLNGKLIEGQELSAASVTAIPHGLGRKVRGWLLTSVSAETTVYDKISDPGTHNLLNVLPLYSVNAATVSVWVF